MIMIMIMMATILIMMMMMIMIWLTRNPVKSAHNLLMRHQQATDAKNADKFDRELQK